MAWSYFFFVRRTGLGATLEVACLWLAVAATLVITTACLPLGLPVALAVCLLAAVGREIYGWWRRAWRMNWADVHEAVQDIAFTMAGGFLAATAFTMGSKA